MATPSEKEGGTYSSIFAFFYIFNLIVGVGALALPRAFSEAGLVLGAILLIVLAFVSYMTSTYMTEAMAAANAYEKMEQRRKRSLDETYPSDIQKINQTLSSSGPSSDEETTPLVAPLVQGGNTNIGTIQAGDDDVLPIDDYEIEKKFEMGTMANMFYHPIGIVLYYICLCLYLYGDLAIYAVAIPKSLRTAACRQITEFPLNNSTNTTGNGTENATVPMTLGNTTDMDYEYCFGHVTRQQAYYIFLGITVVLLCPWTFFNLTRSKYLQLVTTIMRNIALIVMVVIAIVQLGQGNVVNPFPPAATLSGFPILFGVSIYAFMCQHSLPGMITPMKSKKNVLVLMAIVFVLILALYLLLGFTGAFRFPTEQLQDLYTLNFFRPFVSTDSAADKTLAVIGYYLVLFPVFTLSTNFPIISITLRENLKALARLIVKRWIKDKPFPLVIDRLLFPLVAIIPPIIIAFATENVEFLVSITGSFPGIGIQYVVPATLAFASRFVIKREFMQYENKHRSPFGHKVFFFCIIAWTVISVLLVIADDVIKGVNGTFFS